ncbi:unnamed protein product [Ceratitis capitata]|uniref:(Mediterranean fruit fly) hypothetical protein n=1 Tax=Ceratitis capitata TaxID=7213 RepID=A0A811UST0_CERCA|nr:unnamed protein product [Ceratitis capitata]
MGFAIYNIVEKGNCDPVSSNENFSPGISNEILRNVCNDNVMRALSWQEFQGLPRPEHSFNIIRLEDQAEFDGVVVGAIPRIRSVNSEIDIDIISLNNRAVSSAFSGLIKKRSEWGSEGGQNEMSPDCLCIFPFTSGV